MYYHKTHVVSYIPMIYKDNLSKLGRLLFCRKKMYRKSLQYLFANIVKIAKILRKVGQKVTNVHFYQTVGIVFNSPKSHHIVWANFKIKFVAKNF